MNFTNKSIHNPNETFNFCSQENNITIHSYSSQHSQCLAENVLISEQKVIIILNLSFSHTTIIQENLAFRKWSTPIYYI